MSSPHLPKNITVQRPPLHNYLEVITGPPSPYISPRHFHEELEIAFQPGVTWDISYRQQKYIVPPDALVFIQPGEPHAASSTSTNAGEYFGFRIATHFLRTTAAQLTEQHSTSTLFFPQPLINDSTLSAHLLALHKSLRYDQQPGLQQDTLLQDTILLILKHSDIRPFSPTTHRRHMAVEQIRAYLHEHYPENISLNALAQLVNLSPFHLNHIFQSSMGLPPHLYQTQLRVSRAKLLLAQGMSPAQVALQTGFSSQSHLGWHFKRLVGITPGQYAHNSRH